jgi:Phosphofructokinase
LAGQITENYAELKAFPMMEPDDKRGKTLGILVGGGPAPGINSVIAASVIEAANCGLRVIGVREGFRWLAEGNTSHVAELKLEEISRIHRGHHFGPRAPIRPITRRSWDA